MTSLSAVLGDRRRRYMSHGGLHGGPLLPLVALVALAGIDLFDLSASSLLGPEIVSTFHTDAATFGYLLAPLLVLAIVLPFVFGYLGDRLSRVKLTVLGAALWVVTCLLTGLAGSLIVFGVVRGLAGLSRGPNTTHQSLLADYYPSRARGYAYGWYQIGQRVGSGVGLIAAGVLAQMFGWRSAFMILAIPGVIVLGLFLWIREPVRGLREAEEAGEDDAPDYPKIGPVRAARLLLKTPAYKRLLWAMTVFSAATVGIGIATSFYYSAVFDIGPALRGVYQFLPLPFTLLSVLLAGVYGQRLLADGRADRACRFAAVVFFVASLHVVVLAFAPNILVALAASIVGDGLSALGVVPFLLLVARLVPPHIRTQGFGLLGVYQFALTPFAAIYGLTLGDKYGFRVSMLMFLPLILLGAAFVWSAGYTVRRDIARLDAMTFARNVARRRRKAGESVPVLEVKGVSAGYGKLQILFDVDLEVRPGEIVALLGTNGAGKSTLLRAISGLLAPTDGVVLLDGDDVTGLDAEIVASRGLVMMPGGRGIFPGLSVDRNLELGAYLHWNEPDHVEQGRHQAIALFPRLGERPRQLAGSLSGGEQQMLALAKAFVSRPTLLLIDELSLGLAPKAVGDLIDAIRAINAEGVAVLLVEQSVNVAMELADRAYFLEKGEVRFEGTTRELVGRTDLLRSIFFEGLSSGGSATA